MKNRIEIFLTTVAVSALLLILTRWALSLIESAGVDGEMLQLLIKITPTTFIVFIVSIILLGISKIIGPRKVYSPADGPVSEIDEQSGEWDQGIDNSQETSENIMAGLSNRDVIIKQPEVELSYKGNSPVNISTFKNQESFSGESRPEPGEQNITPSSLQDVRTGRGRVTVGIAKDDSKAPDELESEEHDDLTFDEGFVEDTETAAETAVKIFVNQLPPPLPEFTGRSAVLSAISTASENPQIKILSLQGVSGVGKTTLAVRLAHQLTPHYPDAQIYIDLKGASPLPLSVAEAQSQIIRAFLPTARLPENEDELNRMYHSVLDRKWALILLDNAAGAQQIVPLLPPESWLSIVTSRNSIVLSESFKLELDTLTLPEAREMLSRIVPRIGGQAENIADLCGRLPLALRLAASVFIQHPELNAEDYARMLAERQNRERPMRQIDTVLNVTYQLLVPDLQKLWRILAVFPDTFDVNAAASVWRMSPARAAEALNQLMVCSLVERNRTNGRFRLHDLMNDFADAHLTDRERPIAKQLLSSHYQGVLHEADALYEQGGEFLAHGLSLLDLEWQNIQAGQLWAASQMGQSRAACELCNSYPDAGKYVLDLRQHPRERIRWSEAALSAAKIMKRRVAIGRHFIALGNSYTDLSEADQAIECYEQALAFARGINDHRGEADALSGLGTANYIGGRLNRAREYYQSALEIARTNHDQRLEAGLLGSLGAAHYALGNLGAAVELFDRQLDLAREAGDRRCESVALGGLGIAHNSLGNPKLAVELLTRQLTITRDIGDRRGEASALCNLGSAQTALNEHQLAIKYCGEALSVAREIGDRRNEANALGGLGVAYCLSGDVDVGAQFIEHQLILVADINDKRGESLACIKLGEACIEKGDSKRAINLLQKAFNITSQIEDILGQADSLYKLSIALDKFGDRRQAIAQAETALGLFNIAKHPCAKNVRKQLAEWQ